MTSARRIASVLTLFAGAYILVLPFALSLFSRTRDAEKLNAFYRPLMSQEGINHFGSNLKIVDDGGAELYSVVIPKLEHDLTMNDTQFNAFVAQNYPHVSTFIKGAPELLKLLNPATKAVLAQKDNFHDADQFPIANVPMDWGPWALLAMGLVVGGIGVLLWLWPRGSVSALVLVVGLGLLAAPIVLGWFHETDAAEKVAQAARPPFSPAVANTVVDNIFKIDAAFTEMHQAMFPAIAQHLGLTATEMDTYVRTNFPATSTFLSEWDKQMFKGAHDLSLSQVEYMDEFHNADATPYRALPWLVMLPGLLLLVAGGLSLSSKREPEAGP
jgi:hypothetical protein